jgi:hypothetical protein
MPICAQPSAASTSPAPRSSTAIALDSIHRVVAGKSPHKTQRAPAAGSQQTHARIHLISDSGGTAEHDREHEQRQPQRDTGDNEKSHDLSFDSILRGESPWIRRSPGPKLPVGQPISRVTGAAPLARAPRREMQARRANIRRERASLARLAERSISHRTRP